MDARFWIFPTIEVKFTSLGIIYKFMRTRNHVNFHNNFYHLTCWKKFSFSGHHFWPPPYIRHQFCYDVNNFIFPIDLLQVLSKWHEFQITINPKGLYLSIFNFHRVEGPQLRYKAHWRLLKLANSWLLISQLTYFGHIVHFFHNHYTVNEDM